MTIDNFISQRLNTQINPNRVTEQQRLKTMSDRATNIASNVPSADKREEMAHEFETIMVKQFVSLMTKEMFKSTLDENGALGSAGGQASMQTDALNDVLTKQFVDNGTFNFAEMMIKRWNQMDNTNGI